MRIFITVGTTPFDKLIRFCDENLDPALEITIQISKAASYVPKRLDYFEYVSDVISYYQRADLVITHAGAGTIFTLLEMGKRIIVVPNLDRDDSHQKDLASMVSQKGWGLVCWRHEDLPKLIAQSDRFQMVPYERREFFGGPFIDQMVKKLYFGEP